LLQERQDNLDTINTLEGQNISEMVDEARDGLAQAVIDKADITPPRIENTYLDDAIAL
jgi:hypothetical protein